MTRQDLTAGHKPPCPPSGAGSANPGAAQGNAESKAQGHARGTARNIPRNVPQNAAQNTAKGIVLMLIAILIFTLMDATAKTLVRDYPPPQVVFARFLGQVLLAGLILNRRAPGLMRTARPGQHVLRSLFQVGAIGFFFLSLQHIGLAEATAISDLSPVLITLGAALFLGERLGPRRIFGILAALAGALIIIRPGAEAFSAWALLPLMGAMCYTGNALMTRSLGLREPVWTAMLWGGAVGTLVTGLAMPFLWVPVALADLWLFALIGLFGTMAQLFLIRSFSMAEASSVAPFTYVGIVFATLWGVVFYDEWPDLWTVAGALVIVAAGLYVWHRETRAKAG
ncbi:DMT family transporter [Pseudogemmobacter sonorensis]|uniref:DMT family transporter n=1 Tax=Pseudogemmobacter sonorensis TaxID=2989681 RepID=UPI00368AFF68